MKLGLQKRLLSLVTALCLLLPLLPAPTFAAVVASGNCGTVGDGSNVTWSLDDSGTLTITGSGAMADYDPNDTGENLAPWHDSITPPRRVGVFPFDPL